MKKTLLAGLAVLSLFAISSTAQAGLFFGIRGGAEKFEAESTQLGIDEGRSDFMLGGFVGYHYSFFRFEGEYMYHPQRSFAGGTSKIETQTAMGNLYFSPPMRSALKPYFMGGAGAAFHSAKVANQSDDNITFAWQIGAGVELEFTENVFLEVGARYTDMRTAEMKDIEFDVKSLSCFGGLRFEY